MDDKQKNRLIIGGAILAVILFLLLTRSKAGQNIIQNIAGDYSAPDVSGNDVTIVGGSYEPATFPSVGGYSSGSNIKTCSLCLTRAPAIITEIERFVTQNVSPQYIAARPPIRPRFTFQSIPRPDGRADATGRYPDGSLSTFW